MSEDRDRVERLHMPNDVESYLDDTFDDGTPIPVHTERKAKTTIDDSLREAENDAREGEALIREYQEKYYGTGTTAGLRHRAEELAAGWSEKTRGQWQPQSIPVAGLSDDEKLWAALSHASALITFGLAIFTGGWGLLLMIFAPLAIYFAYRERSDFVAFHALQAFALQLLGTVGWLALLIAGILVLVVGIVISALASVVLIGIPFLLLFVLLLVLFIPISLAIPLGMVVLSILGAINTYNGNDYRYPFIANWIERQLSSSMAD